MFITIIKFIILGIIQGFTEPIPISSSGHLLVFQNILNGDFINYESLAILTNFGSFIAIVIVFYKEILDVFKGFFNYLKTKEKKYYSEYKYFWLVLIGCIPIGICGLIAEKLDFFEFLENNTSIVGITLLITALFLFFIKDIKGIKSDNDLTIKDALVVGFFQIIALIPGISRSGTTLVGGMNQNMKRDTAFKYSFMLYLPISTGTMILQVKDLIEVKLDNLYLYILASIISLIVTYFSLKWFRKVMKEGNLIYFVIYCLLAGLLILLFL